MGQPVHFLVSAAQLKLAAATNKLHPVHFLAIIDKTAATP
jgi:hypothetical protein